jgi:hypothetical protein
MLADILNEIDGPVIHRKIGDIPGCIMLPVAPPERSLREMAADTSAFHCRVQAYLASKLDYERVW